MKYTTQKGDTFDAIAYAYYANEEAIAPIIRANPAHVETAVFDYGAELEIPEIEKTDETVYLPPWRREQ